MTVISLHILCRNATELICQPRFTYGGQTVEHCYNDKYCKLYGDCCRNSKYYVSDEQMVTADNVFNNSRYGCYVTRNMKSVSLMIGKCPRTAVAVWHRETIDKCEKNVGGVDDDADFITDYPVTAKDTGHVYKNAYCAWCQGERRNVDYWKPIFQCRDSNGRFPMAVRLEDASDRTLLYRNERWYYADYNNHALLTCDFVLQPPNGTVLPLRPCVIGDAGLIDGCPAGTSHALAQTCASYTYTVFEHVVDIAGNSSSRHSTRVFRNVDCARCNNVTVDRLSCTPPPPPLQSTFGFSSLFAVRASNERSEPCAPDELYDVLTFRCRNVIRDELPDACHTSVRFGPGEYDNRSMGNGTVYVYAYKKRVRYRNHNESFVNQTVDVCVEDAMIQPRRQTYFSYLSYAGNAGSFASAVALAVHLALFSTGPEPKNLPEKNLASLAVSLLLGYASYLAVALGAVSTGPAGIPCIVAALFMQYSFLAAFAWMFVMSADVFLVLHASTKKLRVAGGKRNVRFAVYSAFAWLAPVSLVGLAAVLQLNPQWLSFVAALSTLRPNFQYDCWFRNPQSLIALFVLPAGVTVVANYISFIGAVRLITTSGGAIGSTVDSAATFDRTRRNLKIYVRLSLMMGLAWLFGLIGTVTDNDVVWTLYTVFNSLQGVFILLAFDCNRKIARTLAVFRKLPSAKSETQTTTATPLSAST